MICGDIYCQHCEKDFLGDELEERFDELREQLEEVAGIPVYYMEVKGA